MSFARSLLTLAALALCSVLVAACGSSSSSSNTTSAAGSGGDANSAATYQARLNLAKCFRAHGINIPDPSQNGGPAGGGGAFRILQNYSQAQVQAASQACKQYTAQAFPRLNLTPAQQAQFRQQFVKYAECMRSHGVNIPDPSTTSGGGFGFARQFRSIDRNSPAFQSAQKACDSLRPQFGRRGGAGGPGPGA